LENQLFLWTGKIIWWAVCCSAVACAVASGILAPIVVRRKIIKNLWIWILTAELSKYGLDPEDIRFMAAIPGLKPEEFNRCMETVKRVKERGESLEARKAR
jgi:hypothetical protein